MTVWRIYGDGREFGTDYANLEAARKVRNRFAFYFPRCRYYIRKQP